jgi:hypothetical protein
MQDLLHFIAVRTAIASGHKPYRKTLAIDWESFFQNSKKLTDEADSTKPIVIWGHRESQAIYGGFVKSRDKCPLVSQIELFYFTNLGG